MSAISGFDGSIPQLFGAAEAAIYSTTKSYIEISDLQGMSIGELEECVKGKEEKHNNDKSSATEAEKAKRSGPCSKYGPDKIGAFYASLRAYRGALDTRQPAPAPEFGILSLPFKVQHMLMNDVACILEASCFQFAKEHYPEELTERGWDCAERAELNRFQDLMRRAQEDGRFRKVARGTNVRKISSKNFGECWKQIEEIRHTSVHRNHPSARVTIDRLRAAETLLGLLKDESARETISKLLQQTEAVRDKMENQRAKLKEDVTKVLDRLEEERLRIVDEQVEEIQRMLTQDREVCNDPRTASSLEDMLQRLRVPDISGDNHIQDDTVERSLGATIQEQGEQNYQAIPMQDAGSPNTSTVQPYEGGRDNPAVNGEGNTATSPGDMLNHPLLPDDAVEVSGETPSSQPVLVPANEDPGTVVEITVEAVDEAAVLSSGAAPPPAPDLDTLSMSNSRDGEVRGGHETARVGELVTDQLQSEERNQNHQDEVNAAGDDEGAMMASTDADAMQSDPADQLDSATTGV